MEHKIRGEKLGGTRQRNLPLVFFFDFQAAESCVGQWGGDMELLCSLLERGFKGAS